MSLIDESLKADGAFMGFSSTSIFGNHISGIDAVEVSRRPDASSLTMGPDGSRSKGVDQRIIQPAGQQNDARPGQGIFRFSRSRRCNSFASCATSWSKTYGGYQCSGCSDRLLMAALKLVP